MGIIFSRVYVGFIGLFSMWSVVYYWYSFDLVFAERGMQAVSDLGRANVRADVGGFFLAVSCFTIFAALRKDRNALVPAIVLFSASLMGRLISVAIDGNNSDVETYIIIEANVIALLCGAYFAWGKKPEGL